MFSPHRSGAAALAAASMIFLRSFDLISKIHKRSVEVMVSIPSIFSSVGSARTTIRRLDEVNLGFLRGGSKSSAFRLMTTFGV